MYHIQGRRRRGPDGRGARPRARALIVAVAVAAAMLAVVLLGGPAGAATAQAASSRAASSQATTAQVAGTPPMGFNTWYQFRGGSESVVVAQARALVSTGLAKAGYVYVNLDDGWMAARRTSSGSLTWNTRLYPHGLPWLAAQLHAMGLKFGIYEAIGNRTCLNFPGSHGYYHQDALTFAQWGVDFVKIDECGGLPASMTTATLATLFQQYGAVLRAANPAVVYSQELPIYTMPKTPGAVSTDFIGSIMSSSQSANMWRVAADEKSGQSAAYTIFGHLDADLHLHGFAGPGHWNDLDMLLPGVPRFQWNFAQEQSQIGVWAMEASPLIISTNVAGLTAAEVAALENPVMITIDRSGQADTEFMSGNLEVLLKNYPGGGKAVLLANRGTATITGTMPVARFGIAGPALIDNVWTGTTATASGAGYRIAPGGTMLLVVKSAR